MCLKTSKGKKVTYSLICVSVLFPGRLCAFWCFWCVQNIFVKKHKEFKTALLTSFTLLLKLSYYKQEFFITIFFNYQSFSIITIFFNYHNLFWSLYNSQLDHLTRIFCRQNMTMIFCQFHNLCFLLLFILCLIIFSLNKTS